jgi:hypothetical protein
MQFPPFLLFLLQIYNRMLSNFDLDEISEHYGLHLNSVIIKDKLKAISPKTGNFIINLESSIAQAGMGATGWHS